MRYFWFRVMDDVGENFVVMAKYLKEAEAIVKSYFDNKVLFFGEVSEDEALSMGVDIY